MVSREVMVSLLMVGVAEAAVLAQRDGADMGEMPLAVAGHSSVYGELSEQYSQADDVSLRSADTGVLIHARWSGACLSGRSAYG